MSCGRRTTANPPWGWSTACNALENCSRVTERLPLLGCGVDALDLAADTPAMAAHRGHADRQPPRNLRRREPLAQQRQDLPLAARQSLPVDQRAPERVRI